LSLSLDILGEWEHIKFQNALQRIAAAAKAAGKIFGIAGIYTRPDICKYLVKNLGARYILGHYDIGLLAMAMNKNVEQLREMSFAS
jgi:2-keto-3-deoxy-L-rhamnonate aldolase RhmA